MSNLVDRIIRRKDRQAVNSTSRFLKLRRESFVASSICSKIWFGNFSPCRVSCFKTRALHRARLFFCKKCRSDLLLFVDTNENALAISIRGASVNDSELSIGTSCSSITRYQKMLLGRKYGCCRKGSLGWRQSCRRTQWPCRRRWLDFGILLFDSKSPRTSSIYKLWFQAHGHFLHGIVFAENRSKS